MGLHIYDHKNNYVWTIMSGQHNPLIGIIGRFYDRHGTKAYAYGKRSIYPYRLALTRKDIQTLKICAKPKRSKIAKFWWDERKVYTWRKTSLGGYRAADCNTGIDSWIFELKGLRAEDVYYAMIHVFAKKGEKFFAQNPKSKVWNIYSEA